jgi:hypothetical protein
MSAMNGKIVSSQGVHVADFRGAVVYGLRGEPRFELRGLNIYRLSGELVGHVVDSSGSVRRLDKGGDRLFA